MRNRSKGLIIGLVLLFGGAAVAQDAPADFRLVWLINSYATGAQLGVFAYPEHMTLAACAIRVRRQLVSLMPWEQSIGDYIADKLNDNINPVAVCLTDDETAALVRAVHLQTDSVGERV